MSNELYIVLFHEQFTYVHVRLPHELFLLKGGELHEKNSSKHARYCSC